mmetsp:Transcript_11204/g.16545  ORF Transcript_11204/g.16545 Transcript_11204/m.16545 type:complete len:400 (-) Transcript_11204:1-1200(-)
MTRYTNSSDNNTESKRNDRYYNEEEEEESYEGEESDEEMNFRYHKPAENTRTKSQIYQESYELDEEQIENATATMFESDIFEDDEEEEFENNRRRRRMELSKSKKIEELEKEVAELKAMEEDIQAATNTAFTEAQEKLARAKTPKRKENRTTDTASTTSSTTKTRRTSKRRTSKSRKKSVERSEEDDDIDEAAMGMGLQHQLVFYKSRAKTLEADLKEVTKKWSDTKNKSKSLQTKVQSTEAERSRLQSKVNVLEKAVTRHKSASKDAQHKVDNLTRELASMRKELVDVRKKQQHTTNAPSNTDRERLTRLNKDNSALKDEIRMLKKLNQEQTEFERRAADKAKDELAMVQRQKADLIAAFKKQMKLIDVLKRQQVHLEAAQLLKFSEKEFSKALDFGS